jgi:drug/metabolite transporter (DMT)-like permease
MENELIIYIAIGYIGVVMTALAQVLLKAGANKYLNNNIRLFLNGYAIVGYLMMFSVTLISLYIFKYLGLKYALIFLPSTYILVLLFSFILLKEKITQRKILQYIIISLGIIIFNL